MPDQTIIRKKNNDFLASIALFLFVLRLGVCNFPPAFISNADHNTKAPQLLGIREVIGDNDGWTILCEANAFESNQN